MKNNNIFNNTKFPVLTKVEEQKLIKNAIGDIEKCLDNISNIYTGDDAESLIKNLRTACVDGFNTTKYGIFRFSYIGQTILLNIPKYFSKVQENTSILNSACKKRKPRQKSKLYLNSDRIASNEKPEKTQKYIFNQEARDEFAALKNCIHDAINIREKLNSVLIFHTARQVYALANRYRNTNPEKYADLIADGYIGLGIAAQRFNLEKNIKFITFATSWIFKYITLNFYNKYDTVIQKNATSIDALSSYNGMSEHNYNLIDAFLFKNNNSIYTDSVINRNTNINVEENEKDNLINDIASKVYSDDTFSPTDKIIFNRLILNSDSVTAVSCDTNLPRQTVINDKNRILSKLKEFVQTKYQISTLAEIV